MLTEEQITEMVDKALAVKLRPGEGEPGEVARKIRKRITNEQCRDLLVDMADTMDDDDRAITFRASDERVDRDGDIIRVDGWDWKDYLTNPVFLRAHNAREEPIGKTVEIYRTDEPALMQRVQFADAAASPIGDRIYRLYRGGYMNAVSVGFMPKETLVVTDEEERNKLGLGKWGVVFLKQQLLELSAVSIPSNPNALQVASFAKMITSGVWTSDDIDAMEDAGMDTGPLKMLWTTNHTKGVVVPELPEEPAETPEPPETPDEPVEPVEPEEQNTNTDEAAAHVGIETSLGEISTKLDTILTHIKGHNPEVKPEPVDPGCEGQEDEALDIRVLEQGVDRFVSRIGRTGPEPTTQAEQAAGPQTENVADIYAALLSGAKKLERSNDRTKHTGESKRALR